MIMHCIYLPYSSGSSLFNQMDQIRQDYRIIKTTYRFSTVEAPMAILSVYISRTTLFPDSCVVDTSTIPSVLSIKLLSIAGDSYPRSLYNQSFKIHRFDHSPIIDDRAKENIKQESFYPSGHYDLVMHLSMYSRPRQVLLYIVFASTAIEEGLADDWRKTSSDVWSIYEQAWGMIFTQYFTT